MPRQIFAMGGGVLLPDTGNFKLEDYIVRGSGVARPNIGFVPTASGDETGSIARFYDSYGRFDARLSVLTFFRRTPQDLAGYVAGLDVIHVGGGNTRSMLAVWRDWGLDLLLREAYERGTLLCGSSAGSICWFAEGVTDSIAGELTTMSGLGMLAGSNCPHYDGEKDRRPAYHRLVESGEIGDGIACDDGAGLHYIEGTLHAVASARPDSRAYRVTRENGRAVESQLEVLQL